MSQPSKHGHQTRYVPALLGSPPATSPLVSPTGSLPYGTSVRQTRRKSRLPHPHPLLTHGSTSPFTNPTFSPSQAPTQVILTFSALPASTATLASPTCVLPRRISLGRSARATPPLSWSSPPLCYPSFPRKKTTSLAYFPFALSTAVSPSPVPPDPHSVSPPTVSIPAC